MFAKLFTLAFVASLAVAAPAPNGGGSGGSTTGTPLCCQSVTNSDNLDSSTLGLLSLLGVVLSGLNIPIGQGCAGLSVVGGVSCNQNPVTCDSAVQGELHCLFKFEEVLVLTSSCRPG
jgi:hypothetical protein